MRVRAHFRLGVNFIESLVNRHRVEACTSSMPRAGSLRPLKSLDALG